MTEVSFASSPAGISAEAAGRACLAALWHALAQLPPLERRAYLLNFTDGELEWFWFYGSTTLRQIGQTLQLTSAQFQRAWVLLEWSEEQRERARALTAYDEKFALLWQQLPLNDLTLAALLETAPHNVVRLRQAARQCLRHKLTNLLANAPLDALP